MAIITSADSLKDIKLNSKIMYRTKAKFIAQFKLDCEVIYDQVITPAEKKSIDEFKKKVDTRCYDRYDLYDYNQLVTNIRNRVKSKMTEVQYHNYQFIILSRLNS